MNTTTCMSTNTIAYRNQKAGKAEYDIKELGEQADGSEFKLYILVDLDNKVAYGFKVRCYILKKCFILNIYTTTLVHIC